MTYRVIVPVRIQKELDILPAFIRKRVSEKIATLRENPKPPGCAKLKGVENQYRIRIGSYRIRFEIRDAEAIVLILHCAHRREIYRN